MNDHLTSWKIISACHLMSLIWKPEDDSKKELVKWFSTHAMINIIISYWTYKAVYMTFEYPLLSYKVDEYVNEDENSRLPICLSLWIHIYHVLFYDLSKEDIFHHLMFVSLLTVPGYYYEWGIVRNCNLFFICGLPGGLIYALLTLQKCGYFKHVNEKYFSAFMNIVIRCPGCLFCTAIMLICFIKKEYGANTIAFLIQLILTPFNAIYYMIQSINRVKRDFNY